MLSPPGLLRSAMCVERLALSCMELLCTDHQLARRASVSQSQQNAAAQLSVHPLFVGNGGGSKIVGSASVWCRFAKLAAGALVDMAGKSLQDL